MKRELRWLLSTLALTAALVAVTALVQAAGPNDPTWDWAPNKTSPGLVRSVLWDIDSQRLLAASDRSVAIYQVEPFQRVSELYHHGDYVSGLAANVDRSVIASVGWDGLVLVWAGGIEGGRNAARRSAFRITNAVAVNPEGSLVAAGDCEGTVLVMTVGGDERWSVRKNDRCINSVVFDPIGSMIASGGDDGKIRLFDLTTGEQVRDRGAHGNGVADLVFSPNGRELISAGKDGRIARWSYPDLNEIAKYEGHSGAILEIGVTSDGRFVASGGSDGTILLRELDGGKVVGKTTLPDHARVTALAISPDGTKLAFAASNEKLLITDLYQFDGYAAVNSDPCDLSTSVVIDDSKTFQPNSVLDGAESEAFLVTTTTNRGNGPAFGVEVELSCSNPDITLAKTSELIGPMVAGASRTIQWPVTVTTGASTGVAEFVIESREAQMRDGPTVRFPVNVSALVPPIFSLAGEEWYDGNKGASQGDGDGILENGETIELRMIIANSGAGRARQAVARIEFAPAPGLTVRQAEAQLGDLRSGERQVAVFVVELARQFSSSQLNYSLTVDDARDIAGLDLRGRTKQVNRNVPILTPIVGAPSKVPNDTSFAIVVTIRNSGRLEAANVSMTLETPPDITAYGASQQIGGVGAGATSGANTIRLSVPRVYGNSAIPCRLVLAQGQGFAGVDTSFSIPVDLRTPELVADIELLSDNRSIVQGEHATLRVTARNEGRLRAEGVNLLVKTNQQLVGLVPAVQFIGAIPPLGSAEPVAVAVNVPSRVDPGALALSVVLTQDEFPGVSREYTCQVVPRSEIVMPAPKVTPGPGDKPVLPGGPTSRNSFAMVIDPFPKDTAVFNPDYGIRRFQVRSDIGIASFEIMVGGERQFHSEMTRAQTDLRQDPTYFRQPVSLNLREGDNRIIIQARELQTNYVLADTFTVAYRLAGAVADIPISSSARPKGLAIVIGVEDYKSAPSATYARSDAEQFRHYASRVLGIPDNRIYVQVDRDATKAVFEMLFDRDGWLARRVTPESDIFVFYSGHAAPDAKSGTPFLLPYDVDPNFAVKGYSARRLYDNLGSLGARSVTVFLDACFSGMSRDGSLLLADTRPINVKVTASDVPAGVNVLAAADGNQFSSGDPRRGHGLFSYFLMKGLEGEADTDHDGMVRLNELYRYVETHVEQSAGQLSREQTPQMYSSQPDLELVKLKK